MFRRPVALIPFLAGLVCSLVPPADARPVSPIAQDEPATDPAALFVPADTTDRSASGIDHKSSSRAVLYSLGGTVLLAPVFGVGLIVGPSFGHFYADNTGQAWTGIGLRSGGVLFPIVATAITTGGDADGYEGLETFALTGLVGLIGILTSAVYDIVTADNAAQEYNRDRRLSARLGPTVVTLNVDRGSPSLGQHVGVALSVQF